MLYSFIFKETIMSKYHIKLSRILACAAFLGLVLGSCTKFADTKSPREGVIYMPQAAGTRSLLNLYLIDSAQDVVFGADYGGLHNAPSDINVNFIIDTPAIAGYNLANGTSYVPLPAASYTISGLSSTIKGGTTSSNPLLISIKASKLQFGIRYMLPVTLTNVSHGNYDSTLRTSYFRIDSLYTREKDVTALGALSVAVENSNGAGSPEGSPHLVDGDLTTKYLTFSFPPVFWFQELFPAPQVVNAYTFTSGNDSPDRDPMDWNFVASNDGSTWDTLDVRTGETFASRVMTKHYTLNNNSNKAYTYWRVNVTKKEDGGNGLFQMTEWRLLQYY